MRHRWPDAMLPGVIVERGLAARVVLITTLDPREVQAAALDAGATGVLRTDTAPQALLAAVRSAAGGDAQPC